MKPGPSMLCVICKKEAKLKKDFKEQTIQNENRTDDTSMIRAEQDAHENEIPERPAGGKGIPRTNTAFLPHGHLLERCDGRPRDRYFCRREILWEKLS